MAPGHVEEGPDHHAAFLAQTLGLVRCVVGGVGEHVGQAPLGVPGVEEFHDLGSAQQRAVTAGPGRDPRTFERRPQRGQLGVGAGEDGLMAPRCARFVAPADGSGDGDRLRLAIELAHRGFVAWGSRGRLGLDVEHASRSVEDLG